MAVAKTSAGFIKIRPVRPGAKVAIIAPASPLKADSIADNVLARGVAELKRLGFEPVYDDRVNEQRGYLAGSALIRASSVEDAIRDPDIDAIMALRGGFGSAHLLPLIDTGQWAKRRTALIGYSDITSLHVLLNCKAGLVTIHGPMIDRRLSSGPERYEPSSLLTALLDHPVGELAGPQAEVLMPGDDAVGPVLGGTLSMLAASLGTPYAFDPPEGFILYLDEVSERPYRIDRMLTQLKFARVLSRAKAIVMSGMHDCEEPSGSHDEPSSLSCRDVVRDVLTGFPGPVIYGVTSGHDAGEIASIPFGVRARVTASPAARLIIEEAAASD
jgi:muramoyltetrapeptide carboxypeptidase